MERPSAGQTGVAAAVAVLVPLIVGIGLQKAEETEPKPAEASVSVGMIARSSWGDDGSNLIRYLVLRAAGPPPTAPVRLVDTSGQNATTVTPVNTADCSGVLRRDTGLAEQGKSADWCLRVSGLRAGSEVKGLLEGEKSKLTLTMTLRHRLWATPLLLAILAFVAGVATLLVLPLVRRLSYRSELQALVEDNRAAPEVERVHGLADWVKRQQLKSITDDTLLPIVQRVIRHGPREARNARRDLRRKLAASTLPTDQPIRGDAAQEARTAAHDVSDFLDEDRAPVIHPATTYASYIDRLEKLKGQLDFAARRIKRVQDANKKATLEQQLQSTMLFFNRAEVAELDDLEKAIKALHREIDLAGIARAPAAGVGVAASEPQPLELPTLSRRQANILRGVIVALSAVIGVVAVVFSVYLPTATFGAAADYYRLMAAAAASGAIATAVSILNWRSPIGEGTA